MADPLIPAYRSALKFGQTVTDYVKGASNDLPIYLASSANDLF
jgi:hypothetical protein